MHTDDFALPTHPYTGLLAIGFRQDGRPIWPVRGGDGTDDGGDGAPGADGGNGYTPPASQADLDRIVEQRLSRERAKYADYDSLKDKAAKHDALELELSSDKDKAVSAARDEERTKAAQEWSPRLVRAEFRAAAKGVLSSEQLTALLEDLDLGKYVTGTGDVDEEKVGKKVAAFAPAGGQQQKPPPRQLGQGNVPGVKQSAREIGRAEAQKRFGVKA